METFALRLAAVMEVLGKAQAGLQTMFLCSLETPISQSLSTRCRKLAVDGGHRNVFQDHPKGEQCMADRNIEYFGSDEKASEHIQTRPSQIICLQLKSQAQQAAECRGFGSRCIHLPSFRQILGSHVHHGSIR